MKYGKAIRAVRSARGLTQQTLAETIGLDSSYISLIENGRRVPSLKVLEDIATALATPLYLLLLLGSEAEDLRGTSPERAQELGVLLLDIVQGAQLEAEL